MSDTSGDDEDLPRGVTLRVEERPEDTNPRDDGGGNQSGVQDDRTVRPVF